MKAIPAALTFALCVVASGFADDKPNNPAPNKPEKMTVADVIKALSLDESKLEYIDEPPGKLSALGCVAMLRDTKAKVRVRIEVVYTLDLFSENRNWKQTAVRKATVDRVTIAPVGADQ